MQTLTRSTAVGTTKCVPLAVAGSGTGAAGAWMEQKVNPFSTVKLLVCEWYSSMEGGKRSWMG